MKNLMSAKITTYVIIVRSPVTCVPPKSAPTKGRIARSKSTGPSIMTFAKKIFRTDWIVRSLVTPVRKALIYVLLHHAVTKNGWTTTMPVSSLMMAVSHANIVNLATYTMQLALHVSQMAVSEDGSRKRVS